MIKDKITERVEYRLALINFDRLDHVWMPTHYQVGPRIDKHVGCVPLGCISMKR